MEPQPYQSTLNITVLKGLRASLQLSSTDIVHISHQKCSFTDVIIVIQDWRHLSFRKHAGLKADYT